MMGGWVPISHARACTHTHTHPVQKMGVDDIFELSGDSMHHVMIEKRLVESMNGKMPRGQS